MHATIEKVHLFHSEAPDLFFSEAPNLKKCFCFSKLNMQLNQQTRGLGVKSIQTRASIEVHHFFFLRFLNLGA